MFRFLARTERAISTAAVIVIIVILVIAAIGWNLLFQLYSNIFEHIYLYSKHDAIDQLVFFE